MVRLYFRLIGARIRAQMQYKVSFLINLVGFMLLTGLEFGVVAVLLMRFGTVAGWSLYEVALLYGLTSLALGLAEMIGRGFDAPFEQMMVQGSFDSILIRPLGTLFQVFTSDFQLRRLGRSFQALAVLGYGLWNLPIVWSLANVVLLLCTIVAGTLIYLGLFVIGATVCFWTIKTPEVMNVLIFGGEELTGYPLSIYSYWMRTIFLAVVPLAFVNYPTALWLLERTDPHGLPAWLAWCSLLVALAFNGVALAFWRVGVSRYTSTGS